MKKKSLGFIIGLLAGALFLIPSATYSFYTGADQIKQAQPEFSPTRLIVKLKPEVDKKIILGKVQEKKDLNRALKESEMIIEICRKDYPDWVIYERGNYAELLAEKDDFEKAEDVAEDLRKDIEAKDPNQIGFYWWTLGCIEFARGKFEESVANFEKAVQRDQCDLRFVYSLGRAYLEVGRLAEAVAELEKAVSSYSGDRVWNAIWAVKAHYLLGLAYEKSGWNNKAIEKYQEFLEIWKNADPGIPEVEDAKERVKKLRAES